MKLKDSNEPLGFVFEYCYFINDLINVLEALKHISFLCDTIFERTTFRQYFTSVDKRGDRK